MASVSASYYRGDWHGSFSGTDAELSVLLSRAEDAVDNAIYLSGKTVADMSYLDAVNNAVCAQADFIDNCGGVSAMADDGVDSVSLGKFSYSAGSGGGKSASALCEQAEGYLLRTGLLYRGVM